MSPRRNFDRSENLFCLIHEKCAGHMLNYTVWSSEGPGVRRQACLMSSRSVSSGRPHVTVYVACVCMHGTTALCPWSRRKSSQLRTSYKQQACRFTCAVSHSLGPYEQRGSTAPKRVSLSLSLSLARAAVMLEMKSQ